MNTLLNGITVLDLSRLLPGPFCTLTLSQLGADVIKIEDPAGGDYTRELSPELFEIVNRGKKSITLDLRNTSDNASFKKLVAQADVVIESFRPGVMEKLDCGYKTLKEINPKLVYASLTGYGQTGPYANRPGHDLNYLGYAGVMDQTGMANKRPCFSNVQIADLAAGAQNCAIGILAAVIGARNSGEGCWVDISMLDGSLALQTMALATHHKHGKSLARGKDMLTGAIANYDIYRCRDGKYLAVGAVEPKFFLAFIKEITPSFLWKNNKRLPRKPNTSKVKTNNPPPEKSFSNLSNNPFKLRLIMKPVRWVIQLILITKKRDYWEKKLAHKDTCASSILTLEEALVNEQITAREIVYQGKNGPLVRSPLRFINATTYEGNSPALGEHNSLIKKQFSSYE